MKEWSSVAKNTLKQALVLEATKKNIASAAPKRTRTVKEVAAEDRCMARIWGGGYGTQCKSAKCEGSDYCKRCTKLAAVTTEPVQYLSLIHI